MSSTSLPQHTVTECHCCCKARREYAIFTCCPKLNPIVNCPVIFEGHSVIKQRCGEGEIYVSRHPSIRQLGGFGTPRWADCRGSATFLRSPQQIARQPLRIAGVRNIADLSQGSIQPPN